MRFKLNTPHFRFTVDAHIYILGFGLYGSMHGQQEYNVTIEVFSTHIQPSISDHKFLKWSSSCSQRHLFSIRWLKQHFSRYVQGTRGNFSGCYLYRVCLFGREFLFTVALKNYMFRDRIPIMGRRAFVELCVNRRQPDRSHFNLAMQPGIITGRRSMMGKFPSWFSAPRFRNSL